MTTDKSENEKLSEPLIDDDEFVALMESEFQSSGKATDNKQELVWKNLSERIDQSKRPRRHYLSMAIAALLLLVVTPVMFLDNESELERIKGSGHVIPELFVYQLMSDGSLMEITENSNVGTTLVFKTKLSSDAFVALLLYKNGGTGEIRFEGNVRLSGKPEFLKSGSNAYGYMIDPDDKILRFCLLGATTKSKLKMLEAKTMADSTSHDTVQCKIIQVN